jgi:hypothetical protein
MDAILGSTQDLFAMTTGITCIVGVLNIDSLGVVLDPVVLNIDS